MRVDVKSYLDLKWIQINIETANKHMAAAIERIRPKINECELNYLLTTLDSYLACPALFEKLEADPNLPIEPNEKLSTNTKTKTSSEDDVHQSKASACN